MNKLNRDALENGVNISDDVKVGYLGDLPEKVLQFGEGNFLRGFVDWMFHRMNQKGLFQGKVAVVQPVGRDKAKILNNQDGMYTLILRGIKNGKVVQSKELITSLSRGIDMYSGFDEYLKLAENPKLRVIVSNTTEAGIVYQHGDRLEDTPPSSYPAKLTVFLYTRFKAFGGDITKGFIILPCELIDRNGDNLKKIVLRYAREWNLGLDFITWVEKSNYFLNTLVDRIVTGYPKDEAEELTQTLGYKDQLVDTGEIFHLWVIEGDKKLAEELPLTKAGLNVIWTEDMTPYRTRKVRILNGAHTMTALAAYLYGKDTVKECMEDDLVQAYMKKGIFREVIPTLDLPENELADFANAVMERFANPFIKHYLLSISLNSTSKFKTRVLPSIHEYISRKGCLPQILTFSLAALLAFYRGSEIRDNTLIGRRLGNEYKISDDRSVLELFKDLWDEFDGTKEGAKQLVFKALSRTELWDENLNEIEGFGQLVSEYLYSIITNGIGSVMKQLAE